MDEERAETRLTDIQDISARSPVIYPDSRPRQSLDSRQAVMPSRTSSSFTRPQPTAEEDFEDVGLDDPKPKKRGFLSRVMDSDGAATGPDGRPGSHHGFHFTGRKRGQSGQGAELGNMKRPDSRQGKEVKAGEE